MDLNAQGPDTTVALLRAVESIKTEPHRRRYPVTNYEVVSRIIGEHARSLISEAEREPAAVAQSEAAALGL